MNQFMKWLSMGGYSSYIWPAYGVVSAFLIINLASVLRQKKHTHKVLQQWYKGNHSDQ